MTDTHEEATQTGLEIAVIGMAGSFPGAADIDEFWENLKNGEESLTFPTDEEALELGATRELLDNPGFVKTMGGVFEDKAFFDPALFGYTPLEAEIMDPQARKLHENAWAALEHAGYNPEVYNGLIGLYAGSSSTLYWEGLTLMSGKREQLGQFASAHLSGREFLATLVSYRLNLKGPSYTLLTACSTSLVAIHLACQGILNGECHIALAGGVSVSAVKNAGYMYEEGLIRSRDGHCRAFDANASGTAMGDGVGLVVLKALEDALEDNNTIHAVIKGTAINNDGFRKGAYSAPSIEGQAEVIRAAQQVAEVEPASIGYIETHGTGTVLGDPIEIEALKMAFGPVEKQSCAIGSVKTNVGHLDAAAGVTGFIKVVLCLKHRAIPKSLNFEKPNPKIDFENSPFYVNTELSQWEPNGNPLRAAVSSFGIGGTNAHVVLEESPLTQDTDTTDSGQDMRPYQLVLLSARTPAALDRVTRNLAHHLRSSHDRLPDLAYTLQVGRKALMYRRMLVSSTMNDTLDMLESPDHSGVKTARAAAGKPLVVFMFSGQGSQYENMGQELYQNEPLFREELDRCFEILEPIMGCDLKEVVYPHTSATPGKSDINQTRLTQPLLFAFEYALAKCLMAWDVKPYAMIGHSIGEYVAAHLAGVFSLEDALKMVAMRGKLMQEMPSGSMLSVPLPAEELQADIQSREDICVAAVNSPGGCVLSGPTDALEGFAGELSAKGVDTRMLHTSHAFHSKMMDPMLAPFKENAGKITFNPPGIPYISNVSGTWITVEEATDPGYWAQHVRQPVLFAKGIDELAKLDNVIFAEIGPGKVLTTFVNQHPARKPEQPVVNLVRHPREDMGDQTHLTEKLGELWLHGKSIDWDAYHEGETLRRIPLPTYPFDKKRFWLEMKGGGFGAGAAGADRNAPAVVSVTGGDEEADDDGSLLSDQYAAPESETEKTLAKIWQSFFGIQQVSVLDDFFQLGGDSLKATALAANISKELGIQVPFTELFNTPTIRGLAQFVDKSGLNRFRSLEAAEEREYYPLSAAQKRLFLLQKIARESTAYNLPNTFLLEGDPDREKLENTFKQLLQRHDSLRTSFDIVKGEPVQIIHPEVEFTLNDVEPVTGGEKEAIQGFIAPFDLSRAPIFRVGLVRLDHNRHVVIVDMHHIITDGASQGILTADFMALYAGQELPPMRLQYKDFSLWQQSEEIRASFKKQEEYWLDEYAGEIPVLHLPTDFTRPAFTSFTGGAAGFGFDAEKSGKLYQLAREENTTIFVVLMALFNTFLFKLSHQDDIIVGIPSAGRQHADLQKIIGMFVNTLPIRTKIPGDISFSGLLAYVKEKSLKALENQDFPFEDLVEQVQVERDMSRNPLFDVMFVLTNTLAAEGHGEPPDLDGVKILPYGYEVESTKFDLTLFATEVAGKLGFSLQYSADLFKTETIQRFVQYFVELTTGLLEAPHEKLTDIELIPAEEKERLVVRCNDTEADYPKENTIHGLFHEQVEKTPGNTAVVFKDRQLTYRELDEKADVLAAVLQEKGVGPDTIVALQVERSLEMMIGILGVLKAGGAYLPIDPEYPQERIDYMLNDSSAALMLTNQDIITLGLAGAMNCAPAAPVRPNNLAYIIYTSGSTGKPKGVSIEHRGAVNYIWWAAKTYVNNQNVNFPLYSAISFDMTVTSLFVPLLTGNRVVIYGQEEKEFNIDRIIAEDSVEAVKLTPSHLKLIREKKIGGKSNIKRFIVGGEALETRLARDIHENFEGNIQIYNEYGPTETVVGSMIYKFDPQTDQQVSVPIGTPIDNTQIFILDATHHVLPVGIPGEIYIGGAGLARGYLNRPELTAEKFGFVDFYRSNRSYRTYKTGDLARWLPTGNIEFLGRIDHQVKIRGFRIETGEIENSLLELEGIDAAVVVALHDRAADRFLCAYFVSKSELPVSQLRADLGKHLPDYMIPAYFVRLDEIPLNTSGKVDRKSLPAPEVTAGQDYAAPASELEKTLVRIWSDVLEIEEDQLSVDANFFEVGGNSLKLVRVNSALNEALEREIPVMTLFEYTTVHSLADHLQRDDSEESFREMVEQRTEDIDEGKARMKSRMRRRRDLEEDE